MDLHINTEAVILIETGKNMMIRLLPAGNVVHLLSRVGVCVRIVNREKQTINVLNMEL